MTAVCKQNPAHSSPQQPAHERFEALSCRLVTVSDPKTEKLQMEFIVIGAEPLDSNRPMSAKATLFLDPDTGINSK